jgi:hypothetical protein
MICMHTQHLMAFLDTFTAWKIKISLLWYVRCNEWKTLDSLHEFFWHYALLDDTGYTMFFEI